MDTKHVLVIEDDTEIIVRWQSSLRRLPIRLTPAVNLDEANRLFPIKTWDVIVVDGCLGGDDFNTEELVRTIREQGYTGPMIAASKNSELRKFLVCAGCDEESEKEFVPANIARLLTQKKNYPHRLP